MLQSSHGNHEYMLLPHTFGSQDSLTIPFMCKVPLITSTLVMPLGVYEKVSLCENHKTNPEDAFVFLHITLYFLLLALQFLPAPGHMKSNVRNLQSLQEGWEERDVIISYEAASVLEIQI